MSDSTLYLDVAGQVDVSQPAAVAAAVEQIAVVRHASLDVALLRTLFTDFERLYRGDYPGFFACDTDYHDMHHVLHVTLAAVRLMDGYDQSHDAEEQLGPDLMLLGIAVALFHDSGYIRRRGDTRHDHGAEYTRIHVSRSARFLDEYLPRIGMGWGSALAARLVHYTGYEFEPSSIDLPDSRYRALGALIGTADVMAQMADPGYLRKCRDHLYREFELAGLAGNKTGTGCEQVRYVSAIDLLRQTPEFMRRTLDQRLDRLFDGLHRYAGVHFGGRNYYLEAIERNRRHLETLLAIGEERLLASDALIPTHARS
ncbi:MAG: hypothetical protein RBS88_02385 [Spongiibacteraceae bacterium]|nr:hypothetical protein [Spongiibacteraceae bacterium]